MKLDYILIIIIIIEFIIWCMIYYNNISGDDEMLGIETIFSMLSEKNNRSEYF